MFNDMYCCGRTAEILVSWRNRGFFQQLRRPLYWWVGHSIARCGDIPVSRFTLSQGGLPRFVPQQGAVHKEVARSETKMTVHVTLMQRKSRFILD